jgi:hypothetical protein
MNEAHRKELRGPRRKKLAWQGPHPGQPHVLPPFNNINRAQSGGK